jgi:hypothetical protein
MILQLLKVVNAVSELWSTFLTSHSNQCRLFLMTWKFKKIFVSWVAYQSSRNLQLANIPTKSDSKQLLLYAKCTKPVLLLFKCLYLLVV